MGRQREPNALAWTYNLSSAWRCGLERRFYDDHVRKVNGLTPNLVLLWRSWIRCFTMIIFAWWLKSSKQQIKEIRSKIQPENLETKATPKRVWIRPKHSASTAFSW